MLIELPPRFGFHIMPAQFRIALAYVNAVKLTISAIMVTMRMRIDHQDFSVRTQFLHQANEIQKSEPCVNQ